MIILGVDPGDTTGFCWVCKEEGKDPKTTSFGEIKNKDFHKWVRNLHRPNIMVVEDFIQRPDFQETSKQTMWLVQNTAKKIGALRQKAYELGCIYVELQPSDKPTGYKAAGLNYKPGRKITQQGVDITHRFDAMAHAYYIVKFGYKSTQKVNLA